MSKVLVRKKKGDMQEENKSPYDTSLNEFSIDDDAEIQDPVSHKKKPSTISVSDDEFAFDEDEIVSNMFSTLPKPYQLKKKEEDEDDIILIEKGENEKKRKRNDSVTEELPPPQKPTDPTTRTQKNGNIMKQSTLFVSKAIEKKKEEKKKSLPVDVEPDDEERFEDVYDETDEKKKKKKKEKEKKARSSANPFVHLDAHEEDDDGESVNNSEDDRELHNGKDEYESDGIDDSKAHKNGFGPDPLRIGRDRSPTSHTEPPEEREDFHIAYRFRYRYVPKAGDDRNKKLKEKKQQEESLVETLATYDGIYYPEEAMDWKGYDSNIVSIGWKEIHKEYPDRAVKDVRVIRMKRVQQWFPL